MENINLKKCGHCKKEKLPICFGKHSKTKDGLRVECKSCIKEYNDSKKDKVKIYNTEYKKKNKELFAGYLDIVNIALF